MKILFISLFGMLSVCSAQNCDNAYASASYALAHTKKSLGSNNFDHQRYYAERALTAFEKTVALADQCGCLSAGEPLNNGLDNLSKAIDPKDWETGRYYTKRALANAQELMTSLDICTSGAGYSEEASPPADQALLDIPGEEDIKNPEELQAQLTLKRVTEITLVEYASSLRELAELLGCENAGAVLQAGFSRTEEDLQQESLSDTKQYYLEETMAMQQAVLQALRDCGAGTR